MLDRGLQWITRWPVEASVLLALTLAALLMLVSGCRDSVAAERHAVGCFSPASQSGTWPNSDGPQPSRPMESLER